MCARGGEIEWEPFWLDACARPLRELIFSKEKQIKLANFFTGQQRAGMKARRGERGRERERERARVRKERGQK